MNWVFTPSGDILLDGKEVGRWLQLPDAYYRIQLEARMGEQTQDLIAYLVKDDLAMFFAGRELLTAVRQDEAENVVSGLESKVSEHSTAHEDLSFRDFIMGDWWCRQNWSQTKKAPGEWKLGFGTKPVRMTYFPDGK